MRRRRRRSLSLPVLHIVRASSKSKMEGGARKGGGKEGTGILFELISSQCGLIHVNYGMGN